ncbi:MAG TPA: KTSC domain-containing protein [Terracidiphilus sp.]|nr:KTSC domain-containing protein [Terracidiphilus sp.]
MSHLNGHSVSVQSSLLASVNYQPEESVLDLEFREGGITYRYFHVPREIYTSLLTAESKGSWFNSHIRNRFPYRRLSPTP